VIISSEDSDVSINTIIDIAPSFASRSRLLRGNEYLKVRDRLNVLVYILLPEVKGNRITVYDKLPNQEKNRKQASFLKMAEHETVVVIG
jgi:hypothetical protein